MSPLEGCTLWVDGCECFPIFPYDITLDTVNNLLHVTTTLPLSCRLLELPPGTSMSLHRTYSGRSDIYLNGDIIARFTIDKLVSGVLVTLDGKMSTIEAVWSVVTELKSVLMEGN